MVDDGEGAGATVAGRSYRRTVPRVDELIKDLIVDGGFRPGDKLPTESDLSAELAVSRSAVREALRSLQALGMVEIRHGHGIYLPSVSIAKIADGLSFWSRILVKDGHHVVRRVAEVRYILETTLIEEVVGKLSPDDFQEMREAVHEIAEAASRGERALEADRRFHEVLYRPLDNWVVLGLLRAMWDSLSQIAEHRPPDFPLSHVAEHHEEIIKALEACDAQRAVQAMRDHFLPLIRPEGNASFQKD